MAKKVAAKKKIDVGRITELIRNIKGMEQTKKQLEEDIKAAQGEIKQVMTDNKLEEMQADVFTVRYKAVTSSKFDSKAFQQENEALFERYCKESTSMRFTIS